MSKQQGYNKGRGYDIRVQRDGSGWQSEKHHAWGVNGQLPEEWEGIKQEPDVQSASIFLSTQRHVRADKRKYTDKFERA